MAQQWRSADGVWGFKDPRTLITLPFWLAALRQPLLVATFRHPVPVARSLEARNGTSIDAGLALWSVYNERLLALRRVRRFPIVRFDLDGARYRREIGALAVELGFSADQAMEEVQRCLNCDIQTVFTDHLCIECDACIDICPTDCLTMTAAGSEGELRTRLKAPAQNLQQALFASGPLQHTARVMVKDENLCVHCGLCAERCPTAAWDMQKSTFKFPYARDEDDGCQSRKRRSA